MNFGTICENFPYPLLSEVKQIDMLKTCLREIFVAYFITKSKEPYINRDKSTPKFSCNSPFKRILLGGRRYGDKLGLPSGLWGLVHRIAYMDGNSRTFLSQSVIKRRQAAYTILLQVQESWIIILACLFPADSSRFMLNWLFQITVKILLFLIVKWFFSVGQKWWL